jgi:vancomycin resistance protein YoaR
LRNKEKHIIFAILLFISIFYIGCSSNKTNQISEKSNDKIENKQIGIEQQLPPKNNPPFIDPTTIPKAPKNNAIIKPKVVSSFTTTLLDQHKNRLDNIRRASKPINKYILIPGGTFSFNNIVGKRDADNGYKKAKILIDGERDVDIGGGICQLSSTIYQAAKKLKLNITERHTHTADVHYIPIGDDAAVNYKNKDLKFINTKNYSIQFRISIKKGKLTVVIVKL